MKDASSALGHYRRQRRWTRDLVSAVPDELFDWAPDGSGFTLGGLVRHLIQAEIFWRRLLEGAAGGREYDPFGVAGDVGERLEQFRDVNVRASRDSRLGESIVDCLRSWEAVQEKTERFIEGLSVKELAEIRARHPLTGLERPLWEMLVVMMEHEAHHRGQLSAYLKSRGVEHPSTLWT